jgi:flagellar protein FlgJ
MNATPIQPRPPAAPDVPFERLAASPNVSEETKVAEAARQFEALLLRQILAEARKPVHVSASTDRSATGAIYQDLVNSTLADCISRSGTLGLAQPLQHQLIRQILGRGIPVANDPEPSA